MDHPDDADVRQRAFHFLDEAKRDHGTALAWDLLAIGFEYHGRRVPLVGPSGIWKPAVLKDIPISFLTVPVEEGRPRPYDDSVRADGHIGYMYRGTDPSHRDNRGLRLAMQHQTPLIYFYGLFKGWYAAEYPAYIVGDDPAALTFTVSMDDRLMVRSDPREQVAESMDTARRFYVTTTVQRRLHQQSFRERVLRAYEECCAVCRLRHRELLDAAHILSDRHPQGAPWVSNGLALCKLHHAAFDLNILGINPSLVIEIREDILREKDGPMLRHGLQELDGRRLEHIPRSRALRPREEFLKERYIEFRRAG